MKSEHKPPNAGGRLYKSLFVKSSNDETLQLISDGLVSVINNTKRLIEDVQLLLKSKRFATARFILTTANEEMAKAYILLDMCRLDFTRQESVLRCLCQAFYNHVFKHAYNEIHRLEMIHDMVHAKKIWDIETRKWWPSYPGSYESDMHHDTYFLREMPRL